MSEAHDTPPEDFSLEEHKFELSRADKTQLDLFYTQAEYLRNLTTFVNFPYDSVGYSQNRTQLVTSADDTYRLLRERVKQIVHEHENDDIPPGISISNLLSHLDTQQIEYFNEYHPALVSARPRSPSQVEDQYDRISSMKGMDMPQAVILVHAKHTHQNLRHYLLGQAVSIWDPEFRPPVLGMLAVARERELTNEVFDFLA